MTMHRGPGARARRPSAVRRGTHRCFGDRHAALRLMRRAYELRADVTAYDAAYVALAEHLGWVLLTADSRLSRAPGITCTVEVLTA